MTDFSANWNCPTSIRAGAGRIAEVADACRSMATTNPLLVTDPGLSALSFVTGAVNGCREAGLECAPYYHPMAEGIAVEGIRLVKVYLPRAVADGNDMEARTLMLTASGMGATALQKGLGGTHALAHPLGALYDAHHGLLIAIPFDAHRYAAICSDAVHGRL